MAAPDLESTRDAVLALITGPGRYNRNTARRVREAENVAELLRIVDDVLTIEELAQASGVEPEVVAATVAAPNTEEAARRLAEAGPRRESGRDTADFPPTTPEGERERRLRAARGADFDTVAGEVSGLGSAAIEAERMRSGERGAPAALRPDQVTQPPRPTRDVAQDMAAAVNGFGAVPPEFQQVDQIPDGAGGFLPIYRYQGEEFVLGKDGMLRPVSRDDAPAGMVEVDLGNGQKTYYQLARPQDTPTLAPFLGVPTLGTDAQGNPIQRLTPIFTEQGAVNRLAELAQTETDPRRRETLIRMALRDDTAGQLPGQEGSAAQGFATSIAGARYREGDEISMFAGASPEQVAELQSALADAGLVDEDDILGDVGFGVYGATSQQAVAYAMSLANQQGRNLTDQLRFMADHQPPPEDELAKQRRANPWIQPTYRAPDPATLKATVRSSLEAYVGRPFEDWEMRALIKDMDADFEAKYRADTAAARIEHDAYNHAIAFEQESAGGGTVSDVDPASRLQERIVGLYRPEVEGEERERDFSDSYTLVARNLAGLDRLVG